MKGRESGMPDEQTWAAFFDFDAAIEAFACVRSGDENIVEFGSGYGSFTLAVARRTVGRVHAIEIESGLVELLRERARKQGRANIAVMHRDFVEEGSGLAADSMDHAMLYNILHIEQPVSLLREAFRILRPGGRASIMHWRSDIDTPRGPSLDIRPTLGQCRAWAEEAGFGFVREVDVSACCPFHFGLLVARPFC